MAIQYAGGTVRNDLYSAISTATASMTSLNTTLIAAGWAVTAINAFTVLSLTGLALNTETVTLNGKVYTFKNVINNANNGDVLIGADQNVCLANLKAAVNLGTGAGTLYSSATTLNTFITATYLAPNQLNFEQKTAGIPLNYPALETLSAGTFMGAQGTPTTSGTLSFPGFRAQSALTPQGLDCVLYYWDDLSPNATIKLNVGNSDGTKFGWAFFGAQLLFNISASLDIRVIANKYQVFAMVDGIGGSQVNSFIGLGVPWIPVFLTGKVVSNVTNAAGLVQITSTAHGLTTGAAATIRGVLGVSAANVTNNLVTVLDANNFTLDGTTFSGVYVSGGRATKVGELIVECIWETGTANGGNLFRTTGNQFTSNWTILNGSAISNSGGSAGGVCVATIASVSGNAVSELNWFNGSSLVCEPFLVFGTNVAVQGTINGQVWDCVYLRKPQTRDVHNPPGSMDGKNWWNLTDNNTNIPFGGSFLVVVP